MYTHRNGKCLKQHSGDSKCQHCILSWTAKFILQLVFFFSETETTRPTPVALLKVPSIHQPMTREHVKLGSREITVITPTAFSSIKAVKIDSQSTPQVSFIQSEQEKQNIVDEQNVVDVQSVLKRIESGCWKRNYVCEDCGKDFTTHDHLQRHRRIHTGERPFSCDVCGRAFSQKGSMERHKKLKHCKGVVSKVDVLKKESFE